MSGTLVCERCGYASEVDITDPDGNPMSVEEYMELHRLARMVVVCDECAKAERDAD